MVEPHNQQLDETKKNKFKLSISNKIFLGCVSGMFILLFIAFADKSAFSSPERMGELAGRVVGFLLFPLLIAWLAWRISGRKDTASNVAYNIVLSLIVLGQFAGVEENARKGQIMEGMEAEKEAFIQKLIDSNRSPEEVDLLMDSYFQKIDTAFEELGSKSTGLEARTYKLMSEFMAETKAIVMAWSESYNAGLDPDILDFSMLTSEQEFNRQKEVLRTYITRTRQYKEFSLAMIDNLIKKLSPLGLENNKVKSVVKGAAETFEIRRPIIVPLLDAHIEYGESITEILNILEVEFGKWSYEDETLLFENEDKLKRVMYLYQRIGTLEEKIRSLSDKLFEIF